MTNPLPESAVELAAIELAKKWNLWPADAERMAREAIRAALPAIREAVVGEYAKDAARYRFLRDSTNHSLSVEHNTHKASYMSAADYMDCSDGFYADIEPAEQAAMVATNTIWSLQIYPDTPIGFHVFHAATLDGAVDAALAALTEQENRNG